MRLLVFIISLVLCTSLCKDWSDYRVRIVPNSNANPQLVESLRNTISSTIIPRTGFKIRNEKETNTWELPLTNEKQLYVIRHMLHTEQAKLSHEELFHVEELYKESVDYQNYMSRTT